MGLQEIGKLVAQHSATPLEIREKNNKAEAEQLILRRMFNLITLGMIIIGIGVVLLVLNKSGLFYLPFWFSAVTSCFLVGGVGVTFAGVLNGIREGASLPVSASRAQIAEPSDQESLPTKPVRNELPSVTERTTQLIPQKDSHADASIDSLGHE